MWENSALQYSGGLQNLTFNGSDSLRPLHKQATYLRHLRLFSWDMFYRQSQRKRVNWYELLRAYMNGHWDLNWKEAEKSESFMIFTVEVEM